MSLAEFRESFFGPSSLSASSDDNRQGLGAGAGAGEMHHSQASHHQVVMTTNSHSNIRGNNHSQMAASLEGVTEGEAGTGPWSSHAPLPSGPINRTADHLRQGLTTDAFEIPQEVSLAFAALYQVR